MWMSRFLKLGVVCVLLNSCTSLLWTTTYLPICDSCASRGIEPKEVWNSDFRLVGPIIPILPLWHSYPRLIELKMIDSSMECPLLVDGSQSLIKTRKMKSRCLYDWRAPPAALQLKMDSAVFCIAFEKKMSFQASFPATE